MIQARNATAGDFERVAQSHANAFWWRAIATGIVFYFFGAYAWIPGGLAVLSVIQSIGASSAARSLKKGTYRIPNPNNGAPNGDARNWDKS